MYYVYSLKCGDGYYVGCIDDLKNRLERHKSKQLILKNMSKAKISGYVMAITGFVLILINALDYIFNWGLETPIFGMLGIIFIAIGMKNVRKSR
jgi:hypothetical protein